MIIKMQKYYRITCLPCLLIYILVNSYYIEQLCMFALLLIDTKSIYSGLAYSPDCPRGQRFLFIKSVLIVDSFNYNC